ncbi:MAG: amino-acid N-acetyltransferase [Spirochaetales bacterium]
MDEIKHREQVDLIREVFYYQSRFDGKTIVLKIDEPILQEPHFPQFMKDLAMLRATGIEIILVPGAKQWIDSVLKEYDIVTDYHEGKRVATAEAIPFIRMAAFDVANRLMTLLTAFQANAVIGNFIRARGLGVVDGHDFEHTGRVEKILTEPLQKVLDQGMIPIFPCIGWNAAGKPYNLSSDEIALAVAEALQAEKLFFVNDSDGFMDTRFKLPDGLVKNSDGRVARLSLEEAQTVLDLNAGSSDPDLKYLELALRACRQGTERAHVVDGRLEGAILREIFSNLGIGTMVYGNDYESIRPMRATDISDVLRLMQPLMEEGILIRRSEEELLGQQADYVVYEIDGVVHACGALHAYEGNQGEVAAIATNPNYAHLSMGRKILSFLVDKARRAGWARVFVLTTRTVDWFEQLGFVEAPLESLPEKKRATYNHARKSRIFSLNLGPVPGIKS